MFQEVAEAGLEVRVPVEDVELSVKERLGQEGCC
jgi:hypothetical protein